MKLLLLSLLFVGFIVEAQAGRNKKAKAEASTFVENEAIALTKEDDFNESSALANTHSFTKASK